MKAQKDPPGEQKFCKSKRNWRYGGDKGQAGETEHKRLKLAAVPNEDDPGNGAIHQREVSKAWPLRVVARKDGERQSGLSILSPCTHEDTWRSASFRF